MFRQGKKERVLEGVLIPGCHSSEGPEGLGSRSSSEAKGKAETESKDGGCTSYTGDARTHM